jgi:hypothetical protein
MRPSDWLRADKPTQFLSTNTFTGRERVRATIIMTMRCHALPWCVFSEGAPERCPSAANFARAHVCVKAR